MTQRDLDLLTHGPPPSRPLPLWLCEVPAPWSVIIAATLATAAIITLTWNGSLFG